MPNKCDICGKPVKVLDEGQACLCPAHLNHANKELKLQSAVGGEMNLSYSALEEFSDGKGEDGNG